MKYLVSILLLLVLAACGAEPEQNKKEKQLSEFPAHLDAEKMSKGKKIYRQYCSACHQADGQGAMGLNPPLVDTKYVLGDTKSLIMVVLNGFSGEEIEVKGEIYGGIMPPHDFLSDTEIANLLTYIRNSWGNEASEVIVDEVKLTRAQNEGT
ncbi:MAG: c-type cytochrome [Bacteroidota bacterium]